MSGPVPGLDVSSVQGAVTPAQWGEIAARGTRFIIAKAGNGNNGPYPHVDPDFAGYVAAGLAVGLRMSAYHFPFLGLPSFAGIADRDPVSQAKAHFAACGGLGSSPGELPAVADLEWPDVAQWDKPLPDVAGNPVVTRQSILSSWLPDYLGAYEDLQKRPMILYGAPFWLRQLDLPPTMLVGACGPRPLWLADYSAALAKVPPWAGASLWQKTGGGGRLPSGAPVDTDECADEVTFQSLLGLPG